MKRLNSETIRPLITLIALAFVLGTGARAQEVELVTFGVVYGRSVPVVEMRTWPFPVDGTDESGLVTETVEKWVQEYMGSEQPITLELKRSGNQVYAHAEASFDFPEGSIPAKLLISALRKDNRSLQFKFTITNAKGDVALATSSLSYPAKPAVVHALELPSIPVGQHVDRYSGPYYDAGTLPSSASRRETEATPAVYLGGTAPYRSETCCN